MSIQVRWGLGGKIMAAALFSLIPLLAVILLLDVQAERALKQGAAEELTLVALDLKATCQAQQELLQQKVDSDLKVAEHVLKQAGGGWALALNRTALLDWEAVNQVTQEKVHVKLPAMQAGVERLSGEFGVVDQVRALVGGTCTIFQRMNSEGDLLRVSTNVMKADQTRAMGTFIPRTSPVAQSVIKGETYRGRAFVVNGWYITNYHPLKDGKGEVLGGLFVGVPELSAKSLLEAVKGVKVKESGFAMVMSGEGEMIVHPRLAGQKVLDLADADGVKVYAELARALQEPEGAVGRAQMRDPDGRRVMLHYAAFKPWSWVIAVAAYEDELLASVATMRWWAWGIMAVAALLLAPGGWLLARMLSRPLQRSIEVLTEGAEQIAGSARALSASSQGLASASSQQAASLEETSSSLEEMAAMTRATAANAREADESMSEAADRVRHAGLAMAEMSGSMSQIAEAGGQIGKIVRSIDEIAFQTNLLALNAAVEAARAGEAGAGFAVVAGEVRNLAQRAAHAAQNTEKLIEETVGRINQGAQLVERTAEGFGEVNQAAQKVAGLVHEISLASGEQAQGIDQINQALGHMDQVVQDNAAQAEEAAAASSQMSGQARQLYQVVEELTGMVGGAGDDGVASPERGRPRLPAPASRDGRDQAG